jgi:cellulose synthase/poly-beta-1,6-N-acetylglucosamine synthase-like glycosyltransferase
MNPGDSDTKTNPGSTSVSVVVPVHNGGAFIDRCLSAIFASTVRPDECIVVDDASTDGAVERAAERFDIVVRRLASQCGPAFARNWGVEGATGEIVFFVDADVELYADSIGQALDALGADPSVSAVFGSYDDSPADPAFVSQYRNLVHHWVHQRSSEEATTFWTGCGAVRRSAFEELGGFDPQSLAIEDIEFGGRMHRAGMRIRLLPGMRCKHLKAWRFFGLMKTDLLGRAVPWMSLIFRTRRVPNDLNIDSNGRWAAGLTAMLVVALGALVLTGRWAAVAPFVAMVATCSFSAWMARPRRESVWISILSFLVVATGTAAACWWAADPWALASLGLTAAVVATQWPFFGFLYRVRGLAFALAAVPMQLAFFFICGLAVPLGFGHARFGLFKQRVNPEHFPADAATLFDRQGERA